MKNTKLMEMIGEVSPELIEKYALPDYAAVTTPGKSAEHIVRTDSGKSGKAEKAETKRPFILRHSMAAAVAGICLLANVALIYGIHRMNAKPVETSVAAPFESDLDSQIPQEFEMPDLVGMTATEAVAAYGDRLSITLKYGAKDGTANGVIYEQSIAAGEPVRRGTKITASVSAVPLTLEDYTGSDFEALKAIFTEHAILIDEVREFSDTAEAGKVLSVEPGAGTTVQPGETVTVRVSAGVMPAETVAADGTDVTGAIITETVTTADSMAGDVTETSTIVTTTGETPLGADEVRMIDFVDTDFYKACAGAEAMGITLCAHEADYQEAEAYINNQWADRSMEIMKQSIAPDTVVKRGTRVDVTVPMMPDNEYVSYSLKNVTATGATLVVTNTAKAQWGHWSLSYQICKTVDPALPNQYLDYLEGVDANAYWLDYFAENLPAGENFVNELAPGQSVERQIDWTEFYGSLPAGQYFLTISTDKMNRGGAQEVEFYVPQS